MLFAHLYPSLSPGLFLSRICFMCNTGHEMNTEMFSQKKVLLNMTQMEYTFI